MDLLVEADTDAQRAGGGVLRRRGPAQPRGRPAVLRHHQHLLRTRHRRPRPRRRRGRRAGVPPVRALQGPPPRPAADRHRAGRDQGGHPGALLVLAGQHQRPGDPARGPRRAARLAPGPGGHGGGPRVLLAGEPGLPAARRWALHRRRADARRERPRRTRRCRGRAATSRCATTCGSRKSEDRLHARGPVDHLPQPRGGRTRRRPRATPRSRGSAPSSTGSPPPAPEPASRPAPAAPPAT